MKKTIEMDLNIRCDHCNKMNKNVEETDIATEFEVFDDAENTEIIENYIEKYENLEGNTRYYYICNNCSRAIRFEIGIKTY